MTLTMPRASGRGALVDGHHIRDMRKRASYSVTALASSAGCSRSHLANVEAGRRKPSPDLVRALARVLGVPVDQMYPTTR